LGKSRETKDDGGKERDQFHEFSVFKPR
jgi:hypothetical protein